MATTRTCGEKFAEEFQSENLGLNHDVPSDFVRSQWPFSHKIYVAYRVITALALIGWFIADFLYESQAFYSARVWIYLIYATNWSFILLVVSTIYQAICVVYYTIRSSGSPDRQYFERMPISLKVQWVLQNLAYNSAFVVSISYWSFILFLDHDKMLMTPMARAKHSLNSVFVLVDLMMGAAPFRILHMFYTIVLGSTYSLFNAMYFLNDGTILEGRHYAYNVLNWVNPAEAIVTCILCVVQAVFSQVLVFLVYKLREWIFSKIYFNESNVNFDDGDSEMRSIMAGTPKYSNFEETPETVNKTHS